MAERNQASDDAVEPVSSGRGPLGAFLGAVAKVWNAVMADGTVEAFGRQGLGELGQALKAFPDSIQVQEHGTIFNPTQGEIADAREVSPIGRPLWPSEIAEANRIAPPGNSNGNDNGKDAGYSM